MKYFFIVPILLSALFTQAQTADEIVNKSIVARGGLDKIKAIQTVRLTSKITLGQSMEGKLIVDLKRPGKLREEVSMNGGTMIRTTDGSSGWSLNQFAGQDAAVPISADEMTTMEQKADFDRPLVDYKAKGNQIELLGKEKINEKDAYKLKITLKGGAVRYDYIDPDNFHEIAWEGRIITQGKEVNAKSWFSDYRDVNGVQFPFHIESETEGLPGRQVIVFEKIEANVPLDDSLFTKPSLPAPVKPSEPAPAAQSGQE